MNLVWACYPVSGDYNRVCYQNIVSLERGHVLVCGQSNRGNSRIRRPGPGKPGVKG
jgi:hypothetical protein